MRHVLASMTLLCLFIASGAAVHAAGAGDQEFSKGENLLKNKQYAEARTALESGIQRDPSNIQAHFYLAEACRALEAWICAEEHYEAALDLDTKSGRTTSYLPKTKAKVWRLREETTAWRLLHEAKALVAGGKMKQAQETLESAHEMGLTTEQQVLHQQLQAKLPRSLSGAKKPVSAGGSGGMGDADNLDLQMVLVPAGTFTRGSTLGDDEKPVRQIYLNAFRIDKYEVTVG
ncbi:MAG: SUMF1/EgtB/PvdO family nonheme iron enzyme, partial [Nitrospira sp.]